MKTVIITKKEETSLGHGRYKAKEIWMGTEDAENRCVEKKKLKDTFG